MENLLQFLHKNIQSRLITKAHLKEHYFTTIYVVGNYRRLAIKVPIVAVEILL